MVKSLENIVNNDWLICENSHHISQLIEKFTLELTQFSYWETPPKIILAEREPVRFLAAFLAACAANCQIFLCNPNWAQQEWQQVLELVQPDIIWGMGNGERGIKTIQNHGSCYNGGNPHNALPPKSKIQNPKSKIQNLIMIPTGGSSGKIKFAIHTWQTLTASVRGFTQYFQLEKVNSFCVLPLYHVSGLMQFMRSFSTGGKLVVLPFKQVEHGQIKNIIEPSKYFISLVPTQLQRLLQNSDLTAWLSQFQTVLLGGAPAWDELLEKARYYQIRLAPTYGMTETASQIATLKPDDFLKGKMNSGQILPHAQVIICNEQGETLTTNQIGNITIKAESLALGYYPLNIKSKIISKFVNSSPPLPTPIGAKHLDKNLIIKPINCRPNASPLRLPQFKTDDLGFLDNEGYLNIVGRNSEKIITGGENVYPTEIESAIRATEMVIDVCVIGIHDKHWGQALTTIYVPKNSKISSLEIQNLLKHKLSKFKIPKHWISVPTLPRNSQGKINRQQLQQIATESLQQTYLK